MRILTVRQPWAEAIIFGGKDVENRPRNIVGEYRGPVAIHSGLHRPSPAEWREFEQHHPDAMSRMAETVPWGQEEFGVIIGVVDLDGVHHYTSCPGRVVIEDAGPDLVRGYHALTCSPWAELGGFHLVLANPRPLAEPIPYKGALGLRRLDEATTAAVWEGIANA